MKMLRGRKIVRISLHFWLQSAMRAHGVYPKCVSRICNFYAAYCTGLHAPNTADSPSVIESPALPNWVKFCENENPSIEESDDEFVLPKVAGWADTKNLNDDHTRHVKHMACEIMDSDANRMTEVWRERFNSPDAVCSALAICDGIELSESLMVKILQRFSNDWISAFGFFTWAKNGNCYDMMVDILGKSRNFELMWALTEEMHELRGLVSIGTMTKIMRMLSAALKYEAFENFERFGLVKDISTLNIVMDTLLKEGGVEHTQLVVLGHKIMLFVWEATHGNILTCDNLQTRGESFGE